jgi:hypothetical protein
MIRNSIIKAGLLGLGLAVLGGGGLGAQEESVSKEANDNQTTVGIPIEILGVVVPDDIVPGDLLQAKRVREDSPVLMRVIEVYPHGTDQRYDLEFRALEAGRYNAMEYLETAAGVTPEGLKPVWVNVLPLLSAEQLQPHPLQASETPALGGYRILMRLAIAVWVVVLLELLRRNFMPSRSEPIAVVSSRTLYEELKTLIDQILQARSASQAEWARLESLLLAYWRETLELQELDAHEALRVLHEHPEAPSPSSSRRLVASTGSAQRYFMGRVTRTLSRH